MGADGHVSATYNGLPMDDSSRTKRALYDLLMVDSPAVEYVAPGHLAELAAARIRLLAAEVERLAALCSRGASVGCPDSGSSSTPAELLECAAALEKIADTILTGQKPNQFTRWANACRTAAEQMDSQPDTARCDRCGASWMGPGPLPVACPQCGLTPATMQPL